ncbi:hypothetical protein JTB14_023452 [Gonioctena quinquepunctata]|nr:hypothetical protein JTB14_023452 [Gonioctena quinquepunctata]
MIIPNVSKLPAFPFGNVPGSGGAGCSTWLSKNSVGGMGFQKRNLSEKHKLTILKKEESFNCMCLSEETNQYHCSKELKKLAGSIGQSDGRKDAY